MKLTVDRDRCMKSGQCQYLQPDLLGTDDDGFPVVKVERLEESQLEGAREVEDICPAQAIALVDQD